MASSLQWRRGRFIAIGAILIAALGFAGYSVMVRSRLSDVLRRATDAQNLTVELGEKSAALLGVSFAQSRFRVQGLPALRGRIAELRLSTSKVVATGVQIDLQGETLALFEAWKQWDSTRASTEIPLQFGDVAVTLSQRWGPRMTLDRVETSPVPNGYRFRAARMTVAALAWSAVEGQIEGRERGFHIGFGGQDILKAPVQASYFHWRSASRWTFAVRPQSLGELLTRSGIPLAAGPYRAARVLANLTVVVSDDDESARGTIGLTFDRFPVPTLGEYGKLFGSTVSFFAKFRAINGGSEWELMLVQATLPPHRLRGSGRLQWQADGLRTRFLVRGSTDCASLADWLPESPLKSKISTALGTAGDQRLPPLDVALQLDLSTQKLDLAKASWQLGAGCGLAPWVEGPPVDLKLPVFDPP